MAVVGRCMKYVLVVDYSYTPVNVGGSTRWTRGITLFYDGVPLIIFEDKEGKTVMVHTGRVVEEKVRAVLNLNVVGEPPLRLSEEDAEVISLAVRRTVLDVLDMCSREGPPPGGVDPVVRRRLAFRLREAIGRVRGEAAGAELLQVVVYPEKAWLTVDRAAGRRAARRVASALEAVAGIHVDEIRELPVEGLEGDLATAVVMTYQRSFMDIDVDVMPAAYAKGDEPGNGVVARRVAPTLGETVASYVDYAMVKLAGVMAGYAVIRHVGTPEPVAQVYNTLLSFSFTRLLLDLDRLFRNNKIGGELGLCYPARPRGPFTSSCEAAIHAAAGTAVARVNPKMIAE